MKLREKDKELENETKRNAKKQQEKNLTIVNRNNKFKDKRNQHTMNVSNLF